MSTHLSRIECAINKTEGCSLAWALAISDPINLKEIIPDIIHFVWIGCITPDIELYIRVWENYYKDREIILWQDRDSERCLEFQRQLSLHVAENFTDKDEEEAGLLNIRNETFHFIWDGILKGRKFGILSDDFLILKNIKAQPPRITRPKINSSGIKNREITELFPSDDDLLRKAYYCKIILRANLACASDIIRLLALWQYGGIYIDVDTLPDININFSQTNTYLKKLSLLEMDIQMKYRLSDINLSHEGKILVPDLLHFVWIGDTNKTCIDYIEIWGKTNRDKNIYFWCDLDASLCNLFHTHVREYVDWSLILGHFSRGREGELTQH